MKRFAVRAVETLKTTAAFYHCGCTNQPPCIIIIIDNPAWTVGLQHVPGEPPRRPPGFYL